LTEQRILGPSFINGGGINGSWNAPPGFPNALIPKNEGKNYEDSECEIKKGAYSY
jgi:hypothetical protein